VNLLSPILQNTVNDH